MKWSGYFGRISLGLLAREWRPLHIGTELHAYLEKSFSARSLAFAKSVTAGD